MILRISLLVFVLRCDAICSAIVPGSEDGLSITRTTEGKFFFNIISSDGVSAQISVISLDGRGLERNISVPLIKGKVRLLWDGLDQRGYLILPGHYLVGAVIDKASDSFTSARIFYYSGNPAPLQRPNTTSTTPLLGSLGPANQNVISGDQFEATYTLVLPASVRVFIYDPRGLPIREIFVRENDVNFVVSTLGAGGEPLSPGSYRIVLSAAGNNIHDSRSCRFQVTPRAHELLAGSPASSIQSGGNDNIAVQNVTPVNVASGAGNSGSQGESSGPSGIHDNGYHAGNNPNNFIVNHNDKSQGQGNNHH